MTPAYNQGDQKLHKNAEIHCVKRNTILKRKALGESWGFSAMNDVLQGGVIDENSQPE